MGESMDGGGTKGHGEVINFADFKKARTGPVNQGGASRPTSRETEREPAPNNTVFINFEAQVKKMTEELTTLRNNIKTQMDNAPVNRLKELVEEFVINAKGLLVEYRIMPELSDEPKWKLLSERIALIFKGAIGALEGNAAPGALKQWYYRKYAQTAVTKIEILVKEALDGEIVFKSSKK